MYRNTGDSFWTFFILVSELIYSILIIIEVINSIVKGKLNVQYLGDKAWVIPSEALPCATINPTAIAQKPYRKIGAIFNSFALLFFNKSPMDIPIDTN